MTVPPLLNIALEKEGKQKTTKAITTRGIRHPSTVSAEQDLMTSRGGTMASTVEPLDVDSCPCTPDSVTAQRGKPYCPADPPCFR